MTRLKQLAGAAAALVIAGGIAVGLALNQAGQSMTPPVTCAEWNASAATWQDAQQGERAILAVKSGAEIPKAVGDRLLGDCVGGICTVKPQACEQAVTYSYQCGPLVNLGEPGSWRLCEVRAPLYFLGAWKAVATATPGSFRFFGGFGEAQSSCLALTSGANCLALFDAGARCWLLNDGRTCDHGLMYGPGLGGSEPCAYARVKAPMPCVVDRGAGSELVDAARVLAEEEMR